jgi:hypothetical protein
MTTNHLEEPGPTAHSGERSDARRPRGLRKWLVVLAAGLVGALLGLLAFTVLQTPDQATATVLINATEGNPYSPASDNLTNVQSDAAVVTSDAVLAKVADAVTGATPASLAGRIETTANLNSQVIAITSIGSGDPPNASVASEFAKAYLQTREATTQEKVAANAKVIQAQIETAEKELVSASEAAAAAPPGSATRLVLESRVRVLSEALASLYNDLAVTNATSTDPGRILSVTVESSSGEPVLWILTGFVLGAAASFSVLAARRR